MSDLIIYGLCDPETKEIRYIGKSESGLKRPKQHTQPAMYKPKTKKNAWIKSILNRGNKPKIIVLEVCKNVDELNLAEIKHIKEKLKMGVRLTNMTQGGTGGNTGGGQKRRRPIFSRNIKTGEIKRYEFIWQTEKDGFSVTKVVSVCKKRRKSHMGHQFWYDEEKPPQKYTTNISKAIILTNKNTKEVHSFNSIKMACKFLGLSHSGFGYYISKKKHHKLYFIEVLSQLLD